LIDCETRELVDAKGKAYATLSYFWGPQSPSELLNMDGNSLEKIPESVPMTIEDAITITNKLGIRYIWTDRYYI
jgi:hypothetical protein